MENPENRVYITKNGKKKKIAFSKLRRRLLKHVWLVRIGIISLALVIFILIVLLIGRYTKGFGVLGYPGYVKSFVTASEEGVESFRGRTNVLILGKGGEGHDAPDLTDTIIFVSISHNDGSVDMISLPRDIWVSELI